MPTYEYKCDACGHTFEKVQSIKADSLKKCPVCGKQKLRRLIGVGGGFIFKGSGFYITDYRDAAYKDKAKAEATAGEAKTDSKETKDAKPAADTKAAGAAADAKPTKSEAAAATSTGSSPSSSQSGSGNASQADGKNKSRKK